MKSLWNEKEAKKFGRNLLAQRVYTSRLLGADSDLVLHGGGNTSVKVKKKDFYGNQKDILYVKGSGCDLETIEKNNFSPCCLKTLLKLSEFDHLSDTDMVRECRSSMEDPNCSTPSIEAIVHAVIPHRFVDHTHADAVLSLTNSPNSKSIIEEVYGSRALVIPYVMPGFILAKTILKKLKSADLSKIDALILMNHGIFTFHNDARKSYELMIEFVSKAERNINKSFKGNALATSKPKPIDHLTLSSIRQIVSEWSQSPVIATLDDSALACGYSNIKNIKHLACRGPLTPDHVIRTKRIPAVIDSDPQKVIDKYAQRYSSYFNKYSDPSMTMLDPAPRWAVWPGHGIISFGKTLKETQIVSDIVKHTIKSIQHSEYGLGGWKALSAQKLFDIEYWELEQAKLNNKSATTLNTHQGKVAVVTGSAAGIGFACAHALANDGAVVIGLDLNPEIETQMSKIGAHGQVINLTNEKKVKSVIDDIIKKFGGLDLLVSNAGIFTAGAYLDKMNQDNWNKSMAVNLTSHQVLLKHAIPHIKQAIDGSIVLVGSRNVMAPGAGAGSYSCAKAGLTQLCRVAALELAPYGVRCNIIHPDAVFDTKLWTPEALARSAQRYGITIDEYKTRNLMKTEIRSADVGSMVSTMCGPVFSKTTGSQITLDGGNDRVI
ncbi:MAG: bifunctional aldolase/short-chain dehydrogenase [Verrucomicrobiales bacterium]|nr:bifunctional aldolase/short-chain dehydrogenase [Verrucomicrobiales bacterium]